ncbi:MAG TPA: hypothetical protein VGL81_12190 [Polyangiaceae bacterium]
MRRLPVFFLVPLCMCKPDLDETVSIVTQERVLGVQATPAEGAPSANATFTALVVDDHGPVASPSIAWDFCEARNPLANLGPVSPECLEQGDPNLVPLGSGPTASGAIPAVACRQFGPEVPEVMGNETPGRPVDPDATGGYYQPVSLFIPTPSGPTSALYQTRISCGLAEGSSDVANDFLARYHMNANPAVASLVVLGAGGAPLAMDPGGAGNSVAVGQTVALEVAWAACPLTDTCGDGLCGPDESLASCPADCTTPQGCTGAERYVSFDLSSQSLVDAREGIHVSWFATGGSFALDRTGVDGTDPATTSDNTWQAPGAAGTVHLWVVLRDDRGGIGWGAYTLQAE